MSVEPAAKRVKTSPSSSSAKPAKLAPLFAPKSKQPASAMRWHKNIHEDGLASCFHGTYKEPKRETDKVAAFDMDGTLITTSSGNAFPRNARDWRLLHDRVQPAIKAAYDDGYSIVIFTNQNYKGEKLEWVKPRIQAVCEGLDVPLHVFAAILKDENRKPRPGMWYQYLEHAHKGDRPDLAKSYFVGDAAGRRGDHSAADRDFAASVGLPFKTPEQYFDGAPN